MASNIENTSPVGNVPPQEQPADKEPVPATAEAEKNEKPYGLLVHDNNQTIAKKHTDLMKRFHEEGTPWTNLDNIVETPLFVDSRLTGMVQIADLCAYALRRFLENSETGLFSKIFSRADRLGSKVVGVRHYSSKSCACEICRTHR